MTGKLNNAQNKAPPSPNKTNINQILKKYTHAVSKQAVYHGDNLT